MNYCEIARTSLTQWLRTRQPYAPRERAERKAGCFVTLYDARGELRGCIGTIEPTRDDLVLEIAGNAVSAGVRDPRFAAVNLEELPDLRLEVSVLTPPEPVNSAEELDAREYGVVLECGHRRGVLLPDIEGVDTVDEQLSITRRKAGIAPTEPVQMFRFRVEKYRE